MRNVNDGLSYLNIADGALAELSSITCRQRELAEQAANGVYTYTQRKAITAEANALAHEFNRIVQSTEFNGRKVLDVEASGGDLRIQSGFGIDGSISFDVGDELARTTGTGAFGEEVSYTIANDQFEDVLLADVDGDGALDLLTAGYSWDLGVSAVSIRLNDGEGNFLSAVQYAGHDSYSWNSSVAAADLDGDGALDLVTESYSAGTGAMTTVLFNDGQGGFNRAVSFAADDYYARALFLADINADGRSDIVTAGSNGGVAGSVAIRLNEGGGNFSAMVSYTTESSYSNDLQVADINGDSALDLITAGQSGANGSATVRLNDGLGTFGASVSYSTETGGSNAVDVADVNGDGAPDLLSAGVGAGTGRATVRLNDGHGNFGQAVSYGTESGASYQLDATDVNGDGLPDLVTAGYGPAFAGYFTLRLNDGHGSFLGATSYATATNSSNALCAGDINGDGAPDIVTANQGDTAVCFAISHEVTTVAALDLFSQASARQALTVLQEQLDRISAERGLIGSSQRRLAVALNTLSVSRENADAAAVRITDADIAQESADLVRIGILQQAGAAVLAQASRQPSLALKLLN